VLHFVGVKLGL